MEIDLSELLDQAEDGYFIHCRSDDGLVDLFARNACGDTLIHVAVGRGRVDEVRYLLEQGLDVNAKGDLMQTPLHLAALKGDGSMFSVLLSVGADPKTLDSLGMFPHEILDKKL